MMIDPKESEHLATHVVACGERYEALNSSIRDIKRVIWWGIGIAAAGFMGTIGFLAQLVVRFVDVMDHIFRKITQL